jgi:hypothetical protein
MKKRKCWPAILKRYESCVKKVKKANRKNQTAYNPWAVCQRSVIKGRCRVPRKPSKRRR